MNAPPPVVPAREPAINLPAPILWAIVGLVGVHIFRSLLGDDTDIRLLVDLAFIPAPWSVATGFAGLDEVVRRAGEDMTNPDVASAYRAIARHIAGEGVRPWSPLTYAALHGSWTHVGLNSVWLAAFGPPVLRRGGAGRLLVLAVACAVAGCAAQWLVTPLSPQPMIGASAIISGFMAAAATFIFARPSPTLPFGTRPPPPSPYAFLRNRAALLFLAAWFAVNLLFGVAAQPLGISEGAIAWEAHIGGLLAGLVLFPLLAPPLPPPSDFDRWRSRA